MKYYFYKLSPKPDNKFECYWSNYIGKTTNFERRKSQHKNDCNNPAAKHYNLKVYDYIREHGGFENWFFEILDEWDFENEYNSNERERFYITYYSSDLNIVLPARTHKESK